VRQAGREWRPIIKDELRLALTAPQLLLEGIQSVPQRKNLILLGWEAAGRSLKVLFCYLLVWVEEAMLGWAVVTAVK
jgi:hypothetical protein